jgi:hypothetical protein
MSEFQEPYLEMFADPEKWFQWVPSQPMSAFPRGSRYRSYADRVTAYAYAADRMVEVHGTLVHVQILASCGEPSLLGGEQFYLCDLKGSDPYSTYFVNTQARKGLLPLSESPEAEHHSHVVSVDRKITALRAARVHAENLSSELAQVANRASMAKALLEEEGLKGTPELKALVDVLQRVG